MGNYNLLDIISIISLFIGLLFALFLFTTKTNNKISNQIFGFFLVLCAIDNLFLSRAIGIHYNTLSRVIALFVFLQLPVFYLYINSVCHSNFKLKTKHLVHAIPLIIVIAIQLAYLYTVNTESRILFFSDLSLNFINRFIHTFIHIQVFSYLIAIFLIIKKTKRIYLENYANTSIQFFEWLFQLTIALTILHVFALIKNIYKFSDDSTLYYWTRIVLHLAELSIFCWYVLKALNSPDLFKSIDSNLKFASNLVTENDISSTSKEVEQLKEYMEENEPFLDSSLTIQDLANQMNLNVRDISVLINQTIGQHFFDFINQYRIEKAKSILKNSNKKELTILEILYKVGFNSKSSFNTAFKNNTSLTPTQYRKSALK
jgi:AraC-like DNA-binding protein